METKTGVVTTSSAKATTTLEDRTPVVPLPDTPQGMLAVGPRVTFHFVQNYNKANSYDYYDVVNIDGTSYIAIKDVPANTPITNEEYWVKWNDPNAQMELLQSIVEEFDSRITDNSNNIVKNTGDISSINESLPTKVVVNKQCSLAIIGDSWTDGFNGVSGQNYGYADYIRDWDTFKSVDKYSYGGVGYVQTKDGKNFSTLADDLIASGNHYDKILFYGSINDLGYTGTMVQSAEPIWDKVREAFPNADIYCGFNISKNFEYSDFIAYFNLVATAENHGLIPITNSAVWLYALPFFTSDNFHLTRSGYQILARNIIAEMVGGSAPKYGGYYNINSLITNFNDKVRQPYSSYNTIAYTGNGKRKLTLYINHNCAKGETVCTLPTYILPVYNDVYNIGINTAFGTSLNVTSSDYSDYYIDVSGNLICNTDGATQDKSTIITLFYDTDDMIPYANNFGQYPAISLS